MREVFQQELREVQDRLVEISGLVAVSIENATRAFNESDVALAETVIEDDTKIDALALELLSPPPVVVLATPHTEAAPAEAHEHDIDRIVQRVREVSSPGKVSIPAPPAPPSRTDTPVGTLLATLSAERRSGSLAIATRTTRGVVCFVGGQIVDALYGRHQGDKALARLLEVTGLIEHLRR